MKFRSEGREIADAALEAADLRFRAVMMTSFAFIVGLIPLVIASGAGAATVRAVGTAVFGGMVAASFLGMFVIPWLYVLFQLLREWEWVKKIAAANAKKPPLDESVLAAAKAARDRQSPSAH